MRTMLANGKTLSLLCLMLMSLNLGAATESPSPTDVPALLKSSKEMDRFIYAVKFNDLKTVRAMVERGFDPNVTEAYRGESALMIAVREDSYDVFAYLIHHPKLQLDARANNGDTALMLAAWLEKVDWVSELIFAGASVNQSGWTALHYAAAVGHEQIVAVLLENKADVNAHSPNQTTPLMMAARKGSVPVARLLLQAGANRDLRNALGMNALDFAIESEKQAMQAFLK